MNYAMGTVPEVVGNDIDVSWAIEEAQDTLRKYEPNKGSGSYGVLVPVEASIASAVQESGDPTLMNLHNQLKTLLESEMKIARDRQVKIGNSTQEQELQKLASFNQQRQTMIESQSPKNPVVIVEDLQATPGATKKGGALKTVLLLGALGAGAYFMFKG